MQMRELNLMQAAQMFQIRFLSQEVFGNQIFEGKLFSISKNGFTSQTCRTAFNRSAVERCDPGASNRGMNLEIQFLEVGAYTFRAHFATFKVVA